MAVSLPPKPKKVITIYGVLNGKILVHRDMFARSSSLPKFKRNQKVSLPDDWAKWMLAENEKDKLVEAQSSTLFADKTKADISLLDSKIEKLMNAYLENALSLEEYREMKNKLVNEKQLLKEKLSAFEQKKRIIGSNLPKSF